jgi:hypothetical protein
VDARGCWYVVEGRHAVVLLIVGLANDEERRWTCRWTLANFFVLSTAAAEEFIFVHLLGLGTISWRVLRVTQK